MNSFSRQGAAKLWRLCGKPPVVLALFCLALLLGWRGFDILLAVATGRPLDFPFTVNLRTTQYFFCYQELGFIRRGLVGTLLHPFPALTTRIGLALVTWAILAAFALQFWRFFLDCTAAIADRGRGILALLCAAMPAFFPRLGYDFGRFDPLDLVAGLAGIVCVLNRRWLIAAVVMALGLLVHEDFLLFEMPLIVALAYEELQGSAERNRAAVQLLAVPLAATVAVMVFGRSRTDPAALLQQFAHNRAYLAALPDGRPQTNEILVLTRTLADNFALNRRMFAEKLAVLHLPLILLWFWFIFRYVVKFYRGNGLRLDLLFAAAFSPLLLGVVGFDYYRWVAMTAVNLVVVMLLHCRRLAARGSTPQIVWDVNAKILAASLALGPISNTKAFIYPFLFLERVVPHHIIW